MATAAGPGADAVRYEPVGETRFAVVIYGGVSLAIYINGVAQEMLKLVRATAPAGAAAPGTPLLSRPTGTEQVYRKLGQLLGNADRPRSEVWAQIVSGAPLPIRTRFVIDVLSGTSAGGINALFLGKALVNNQPLRRLESLWIAEGDIEKLINDQESIEGALARQKPPQSLLNSGRMYAKLLDALDGMERRDPGEPATPLVDSLDLYSTATDIHGLPLPVTLADGMVYERRHRNVFHFDFAARGVKTRNAFTADNNPFLAYAARCTSAFPFAFEPMTLDDIFPILRNSPAHAHQSYCDPDRRYWEKFYRDYRAQRRGVPHTQAFEERAFGDGGYLDNKPFSYAIDAMLTRYSDLPVARKLIYVEPNPDPFEQRGGSRPNAVENSLAALLTLPRYETIRQDLERVIDRNLQLERINRVVHDVEKLLSAPRSGGVADRWMLAGEADYGAGYAVYERLKLSSVTDELADLIASELDYDVRSTYGTAFRALAGTWRDNTCNNLAAQRQFLLDFDVQFRLRRIRHVWRKINDYYSQAPQEQAEYRRELQRIRDRLSEPYMSLQQLIEPPVMDAEMRSLPAFDDAQLKFIANPEASDERPDERLYPHWRERSESGRRARALYVLQEKGGQRSVTQIADHLRGKFTPVLKAASEAAMQSFAAVQGLQEPAAAAREDVRSAYEGFEKYDSAAFPITFGTAVGERDPIDVHRISPTDARTREEDVLRGRPKLRGQALGAFAAFLDRGWRRNDILWGRLDAAERLIGMLLPQRDPLTEDIKRTLIDEAHQAIVAEFLELRDGEDWRRALREFVAEVRAEPQAELVARCAARATAVVGELLEGIAAARQWPGKPIYGRIALVGRMFWHLVEVSVPRNWRELFGSYWMQLLLLFATVLLGLTVYVGGEMWKVGAIAMLVVVVLFVARQLLRRYLRSQTLMHPAVSALLAVLGVVGLAALIHELPVYTVQAGGAASVVLESLQSWWSTSPGVWRTRSVQAIAMALTTASAVVTALALVPVWRAATRANEARRACGVVRKLSYARHWSDVVAAIGLRNHAARAATLRAVRADFGLIAAYALLSVSAGLWLFSKGSAAGVLVALFGAGAAACDSFKNTAVLSILEQPYPPATSEPLPRSPARYARMKWLLLTLAAISALAAQFAGV